MAETKSYSEVKFSIPADMKDVIENHPFYRGVKNCIVGSQEAADGTFKFTVKPSSVSASLIVGLALADNQIPYELSAKNENGKHVEFLKVQYETSTNGIVKSCYEANFLDENNKPKYLVDPDDTLFVENIADLPLKDIHKNLINEAKVFKIKSDALKKTQEEGLKNDKPFVMEQKISVPKKPPKP